MSELIYFGTRLSENISRREPEGYLICLNVPVARTGVQEYLPEELGLPPDDAPVPVYRPAEEVFDDACMASFEGMPVTDDHPRTAEGVTAENIRYLQKGHAHNVRRGEGKEADLLLADLIITDPDLQAEILGGKREISCGYNYTLAREGGRYLQRNIRGNHIAVVDAGRAGPRVAIRDHAKPQTPGKTLKKTLNKERRTNTMKTTRNTPRAADRRRTHRDPYALRTARLMARMARDGDTAELAEMIAEMVTVDPQEEPVLAAETAGATGEIAESVEQVLQAAEEAAEEAGTADPVAVAVPENHEITIDCGEEILSLLNRILSLLEGSGAGEAGVSPVQPDCGGQAAGPANHPRNDCNTPNPVSKEARAHREGVSPAHRARNDEEAPAEALAEAVAEAVVAAAGEEATPEDPVEALVAEAVEEAVNTLPEEGVLGEVLAATGNPEEKVISALLQEEQDEETEEKAAISADSLRAAMATFRPILKSMNPEARQKAVRKIADSLKSGAKKHNPQVGYGPKGPILDAYSLLKGAPRPYPSKVDGSLGKSIMEKRNANLRK